MLDPSEIRDAIDQVMRPGHFFAGRTIGLEWGHLPREEVSWEIYRGRLLAPAFSRQRQSFESWNLWQLDASGRSAEPLLAIKLDVQNGQLHVVRAILTHDWEPYDTGGNVIDSRPVQKWARELVGTIDLASFTGRAELETELAGLLFQAVVGASRLALTSLEAPLPAFSLGELAYVYRPGISADHGPLRSSRDLIDLGLPAQRDPIQQAKVLEAALRAAPGAERLGDALPRTEMLRPELLLALFNEVALSPYTDFVEKALALARHLHETGVWTPDDHVDFLGTLLRQIGRHLTAFDLVTFHHRGANYPDALLLNAALHEYLNQVERHPDLFADRLRRRALRQAWLLRRHYEGHPVPDAPTSEGENVRVLPPAFARVPEEQILEPRRRQRQLFAGEPLELGTVGRIVLEQSLADLEHPDELQELGTALFLDRPLGIFKQPGEPDRTPLLSYVAFSRLLAERRLRELAHLGSITAAQLQSLLERLAGMEVKGIGLSPPQRPARPGAASLADAYQVASDFVLLRTTRRSMSDFVKQIREGEAPAEPEQENPVGLPGATPRGSAGASPSRESVLDPVRWQLIVGGAVLGQAPQSLMVFDTDLQPHLELEFDPAGEMIVRGGREFPRQGLRLLRKDGRDHSGQHITLHSNPGKHG